MTSPLFPLNKRLGGPQSWAEHFETDTYWESKSYSKKVTKHE